MRRLALGLALAGAAVGAAPAAGGPLDVRPTPVGVAEREFRITPYRRSVVPGPVKLNVRNLGEDSHDLVVISPHGNRVAGTGEIVPGAQAVLQVKLRKAGVYRLVCTRADHAARGMRTRLVVQRAPLSSGG
jgi:plastocyanin